ncbi:MAG: metallophosphoesterase [Deltaproteobacteria bacterium]|nr:metallophosphoesterase [Deltaproteobacteria bacterium]
MILLTKSKGNFFAFVFFLTNFPSCASLGILNAQESGYKTLKIITFGDSGTGTETQMTVARSMRRICAKFGCEVGVMLGDNFYENGVGHVDDKQFLDKFEGPYGPLQIPFYVVLGNHDDRGDTQAQIEYTQRSRWWKMPARYYDVIIGDVHLIALDTNDFDQNQQRFVADKLKSSSARWKVVFGHHPIHSYGSHGDTGSLVDKLLSLLCEHGSLYLSGHDHDLQVMQSDCGLPLIVSGAAAKLRSTKMGKRSLFAQSTYGYTVLEFKKDSFDMFIHSSDDSLLYQNSFARRGNDPNHSTYYKPIASSLEASCNPGEAINGFKYKNSGDDHVLGMFCQQSFNEADIRHKDYVAVANLFGFEYDVSCPHDNQIVIGARYNPSGDEHLEGFYCVDRTAPPTNKKPYFQSLKGIQDLEFDISCKFNTESVVGVRFDDWSDKHIEGVYCQ